MNCVNYSKEKISLAYKLVNEKSSAKDIKALNDLLTIDKIFAVYGTYEDSLKLDVKLRTEYKTIEMMENIQMRFYYNDGRPVPSSISREEKLRNRLVSDRAGIVADILLKHGRIKCLDEVYENKDNWNKALGGWEVKVISWIHKNRSVMSN